MLQHSYCHNIACVFLLPLLFPHSSLKTHEANTVFSATKAPKGRPFSVSTQPRRLLCRPPFTASMLEKTTLWLMMPGEKYSCSFLFPYGKVFVWMLLQTNVEVLNINWQC